MLKSAMLLFMFSMMFAAGNQVHAQAPTCSQLQASFDQVVGRIQREKVKQCLLSARISCLEDPDFFDCDVDDPNWDPNWAGFDISRLRAELAASQALVQTLYASALALMQQMIDGHCAVDLSLLSLDLNAALNASCR
jgi:hypothetical protein